MLGSRAMILPDIEVQARRSFGARSGTRDFGAIEWVADGGAASAEMSAALAVFEAGRSNAEHTPASSQLTVDSSQCGSS